MLRCPVNVPDGAVDTESNLRLPILRKNLYRLGLPHDSFEHLADSISMLLEFRNKIAHGAARYGISEKNYLMLRDAVFLVMNEVSREISRSLLEKRYLRANAGA